MPDLGSYRPSFLLLCVAKLFERHVHERLIWFLEANELLPAELTRFRINLAAQNSILDYQGDLEHSQAAGLHTLAAFLGAENRYDSVSSGVMVDSPHALGLIRGDASFGF